MRDAGAPKVGDLPVGEAWAEVADVLDRIGRLAAQVGQEEARDDRAPDLDQAEAGAVEVLDRVHVRRGGEGAVEPVGPGVVRALDAPADLALRLLDEARAAMAAGVEEDPRGAVLTRQREDAGLADLAHQVAARLGDERGVAQAHPAAVEVLDLPGEDRGVGERRRRQHRRALDRAEASARRRLDQVEVCQFVQPIVDLVVNCAISC